MDMFPAAASNRAYDSDDLLIAFFPQTQQANAS
jgi:hypothetical protein